MKKNMGTLDRIIRVLLAVVIVVLYLNDVISGVAAGILGIVALIFLATALIGICPLYIPLKISTIGKKSEP